MRFGLHDICLLQPSDRRRVSNVEAAGLPNVLSYLAMVGTRVPNKNAAEDILMQQLRLSALTQQQTVY